MGVESEVAETMGRSWGNLFEVFFWVYGSDIVKSRQGGDV